jgi:hypothetical protein
VSHPFFGGAFRRDPDQPPDLHARIDAQLTERIEEAVDFVCLDALVESRRARQMAHPAADSAEDRAEFEAGVRRFLERLEESLLPLLTAEQRRGLPADRGARGERERLALQVMLAKALPDYWQRFDALRTAFTADIVASPPLATDPDAPHAADAISRRERRGRLRRFLGGG